MVSVLSSILKRGASTGGVMSITDHIEDLRWHIIRSLIAVIVCSIIAFFNIERIFDNIILGPAKPGFVSYRILCYVGHIINVNGLCLKESTLEFQNTELSGQFMMSFSIAFVTGFILAFPYVFYEIWKFIKPALKQGEIK